MAEINTVIAEASQDLQTIEDFVNLPADSEVYPRLLPSVNVGTLAGTRQAIFEAGGLPATPFATKALMTASALADGKYAQVTDDTADNNGLYIRSNGAWSKSNYDTSRLIDLAINNAFGRSAVVYESDYFTEVGSSSSYRSTPYISTSKNRHIFFIAQHATRSPIYGIRADGSEEQLLGSSTFGNYVKALDMPDNVVKVRVESVLKTSIRYSPSLEPVLIVAPSKKELIKGVMSYLKNRHSNKDFALVDTHARFTGREGYNTTHWLPVIKGMTVRFNLNTSPTAGAFYSYNGDRIEIDKAGGKYIMPNDGYFGLSIYNSKSDNYLGDYINEFYITYNDDNSFEPLPESVTDTVRIARNYLPTPVLKATRDINFLDGTTTKTMQYLWHDEFDRFYISNSKQGDKHFVFDYQQSEMHNKPPSDFVMSFDNVGNIICLFRVDTLNYGLYDDNQRLNPIILLRDKGYEPFEIDFGDRLKPCGWNRNGGRMTTENAFFIAEYTRPSVQTANCWKATYPLTDPNNWKTVQSWELSTDPNPPDKLKHMHQVERDPYTGFIYTSTGDNDPGADIYVSTDNGETFTPIVHKSEKYARVLNFVFADDGFIYWSTDSMGDLHYLFKAPRNEQGILDAENIVDIIRFPDSAQSTYASVYMPNLKCIVFLGRDGQIEFSEIWAWDLIDEQLKLVGKVPVTDITTEMVGFRMDCIELYPRDNTIACGFSWHKSYKNTNGVLGNEVAEHRRVNNLLIKVDRVIDGFSMSVDTSN